MSDYGREHSPSQIALTTSRLLRQGLHGDKVAVIVKGCRIDGSGFGLPTERDKVIAGILHRRYRWPAAATNSREGRIPVRRPARNAGCDSSAERPRFPASTSEAAEVGRSFEQGFRSLPAPRDQRRGAARVSRDAEREPEKRRPHEAPARRLHGTGGGHGRRSVGGRLLAGRRRGVVTAEVLTSPRPPSSRRLPELNARHLRRQGLGQRCRRSDPMA
jgi:hypothetical protein